MRILFTTAPLPGHFLPLVPLAWAFRSAGHEVLVGAVESFVPAVVRSGLPVASSGPAIEFTDLVRRDRAAGAGTVASGSGEQRRLHGRGFGRIAAHALPGIAALVRAWEPTLIVSERAEFAGPIAAAVHGVPWVRYHWSVAGLHEYRDAAAEEFGGEPAALGLSAMPEPGMVLDPWPESLRLPHARGHHGVRHVPFNGDAHVPSWAFARRDRPRVCVTLGTLLPRYGVAGDPEFMVRLLRDLARPDIELLVAVDDDIAASWPPLPAGVLHAGRLPLAEVLATCDAVVHHGGQGTALTALLTGRPQLVLPQMDDQFENADAVVRAGAGVRLSPGEITPEAVAEGCREVLGTPRYAEAAARVAGEMTLQPSPFDVVRSLEDLAGCRPGAGPRRAPGRVGAPSR
ncbi:nucleotide disphospho-sugar-binding domain-containing protein [Sphaerisporangium perillae]|uniref:nucleotide disphospho-sugar-binding domain-containing protein n=1 Tax=Sphaerisporangium perillae TaxID=2935860 RepID=UPI00200D8AB8|nr:nucleotide disphospho-sugar-binding domain-containing protein [Sphaerisporangium perillae]